MRRYSSELYLGEDHIPACFGKSWEPDDSDCDGCSLRGECKPICLGVQRASSPSRTITRSVDDDVHAVSVDRDNGIIKMKDGSVMLMPTEEEPWAPTLGKNVLAGALSAMGTEVARFFKRFRFR